MEKTNKQTNKPLLTFSVYSSVSRGYILHAWLNIIILGQCSSIALLLFPRTLVELAVNFHWVLRSYVYTMTFITRCWFRDDPANTFMYCMDICWQKSYYLSSTNPCIQHRNRIHVVFNNNELCSECKSCLWITMSLWEHSNHAVSTKHSLEFWLG